MILETTRDINLIQSIMTDSDIWEKIKIDRVSKEEFKAEIPSNMLVLAAKVENVIGLHLFRKGTESVIYHPMLLKSFRKEFGREFFDKGIKWLFNNTPYKIIDVEIPITHRSTINLAKHLNFKESGIKKEGVEQNGHKLDLQLLRLEQ